MSDFAKVALPFLGVVIASVMGFFLNTVTEELRSSRSVVYSLNAEGDSTTVAIQNVSRVPIEAANFQITCIDRPCFRPGAPDGTLVRFEGQGMIASQDIRADVEHTSLISLRVSLIPGARTLVRVFPTETAGDLLFLYRPDPGQAEALRMLRASSATGFVIRNYIEMFALVFLGSLIFAAAMAVIALASVVLHWRRPRRDPKKETGDAPERPSPSALALAGLAALWLEGRVQRRRLARADDRAAGQRRG
ncbi:hypothetical protein [Roseitranquillus sediminis]|uniref:hypothetical protein n=1 Tax=Roseitranquillus sediminis TaxID=2809051 RepID=UPI001D0C4475|nr:hypothetical protein [Roseitranquillus sediminis]MBM9594251.1 hypothetical protein [Roseitranquillus sediminis]